MVLGRILDSILRREFEARVDPRAQPMARPPCDPSSSGELRRRATVLAALGLVVATAFCAVVMVVIFGGAEHRREAYFLVPATTVPAGIVSAAVYLDHERIRASFASARPSYTLLQASLFFSIGGTLFTWRVAASGLVISLVLTFPLMLWSWMIEIGMGLATPLLLPGTFAAVTFGLARRLAARSMWWWSAPIIALILVLVLGFVYLRFESRFYPAGNVTRANQTDRKDDQGSDNGEYRIMEDGD